MVNPEIVDFIIRTHYLRAWQQETPHAKADDFVFPSHQGEVPETALRFQFRSRLRPGWESEKQRPGSVQNLGPIWVQWVGSKCLLEYSRWVVGAVKSQ
jgi:hypothetical protein